MQRHWAKGENLPEQGLPLKDRSGYTDTPITTEGKALEHETPWFILLLHRNLLLTVQENPIHLNMENKHRYVKLLL